MSPSSKGMACMCTLPVNSSHQGKAGASEWPIHASLEPGKLAIEVKRMFVHTTARRRSVAKVLIRSIEKEALTGGYDRVIIEAEYDLVEARNLHEKLGYTYVERFRPYKTSVQNVCMQMSLRIEENDLGQHTG